RRRGHDNCFGRGGDFTVVVEEPQCEDSCGSEVVKRVEFKVWSQLLASWSAVFDKMINTEEFVEQKKAQVITDFSSGATEIFLRFLYSGIVEGPLETLVEVCAMADKYQAFQKGLNPDNACQLFAAAARFRLEDLRRMALEEIWVKAEDVLKECPSISPELFEEILAPGLICMSHPDLRVVLQGWSSGRKRKAGEETILSSPLQPVIERHLERLNDEGERHLAAFGPHAPRTAPESAHCRDIFKNLFRSFQEQNDGTMCFLGYFLMVVFGPKSWAFRSRNPKPREEYFGNHRPFSLSSDSIAWMLPHESVYLMGLSFVLDMPEQVHCRIFCSEDGVSWHLAADSGKSKIEAGSALTLSRPPSLVKWFKLEVLEGDFHNNLRISGIRRDDLPA
ncbi:bath-40, partial [Symbiodinium sp. CCMP2456]